MPDFVHPAPQGDVSALAASEDEVLADVRRRSDAGGVQALSRDSAALLHPIALLAAPRRILEIGTGYGCSGILLARALTQDGLLFTIERDPARATIAREHFERAGLASRVNVMVGEAVRLVHKVAGPFDLIFQDGSTDQYETVLDRLVALLRPRGVMLSGRIEAMTGFNRRLAASPQLATAFLPMGGGVAISVKRDEGRDPGTSTPPPEPEPAPQPARSDSPGAPGERAPR